MTTCSVPHVAESKKDLVKDVHRLSRLGVILEQSRNGTFMVHHKLESSFVVMVKSKKYLDQQFVKSKE